MRFWILWGVDALFASVPLYFFFAGLLDGSVSSFNIVLWGVLLMLLAAVMVGSILLHTYGHNMAAYIVLLVLAIPGLLGALFILAAIILKPRWN